MPVSFFGDLDARMKDMSLRLWRLVAKYGESLCHCERFATLHCLECGYIMEGHFPNVTLIFASMVMRIEGTVLNFYVNFGILLYSSTLNVARLICTYIIQFHAAFL